MAPDDQNGGVTAANKAVDLLLTEPSFLDAIRLIEADSDLPQQTKIHWMTSLRRIAKWPDAPLQLVPARWTSVRIKVEALHAAQLAVTPKTLTNHKCNLRAALRWMLEGGRAPARGVALSESWSALSTKLTKYERTRLSGLMRFCSARDVEPVSLGEDALTAYLGYRSATTRLRADVAARRLIARAWNTAGRTIEGWPIQRLMEPPIACSSLGPEWNEFLPGLRDDLERYLASLRKARRLAGGRRSRPNKVSTIWLVRQKLVPAVRMAVRNGVALEAIESLHALLRPPVSEIILNAYWKKDGDEPKIYTIDLARLFHVMARELGGLSTGEVENLEEMRGSLEAYRKTGLTDKNLKAIREMLAGESFKRLLHAPAFLMQRAREAGYSAPKKAAVLAQMAVAIRILCVAPIHLSNLGGVRLGEHLVKPGGPADNYRLIFRDHEVKNHVDLDFPLDASTSALINEYVHDHRPALLHGRNDNWLFPGADSGPKGKTTLSAQVTDRIQREIGIRLTVHQFRHLAAAKILERFPGNYELARRLLGHRNIQTTMRFYVGLETTQATRMYGDLVSAILQKGLHE